MITLCPACLNSGDTTLSASTISRAKAIKEGGTVISMNVPDMESLPPIAAVPNLCCAHNAPKSAANGLPHFSLSLPRLSKYSWRVKRTFA